MRAVAGAILLAALVGCGGDSPAGSGDTGAAGGAGQAAAAGAGGESDAGAGAGAAGSTPGTAGAAGSASAGRGGRGGTGAAGQAGSSTGAGGATGATSYPTCSSPFKGDDYTCTSTTKVLHKDGKVCALCSTIPGGQTGIVINCIVPQDGMGSGGDLCVSDCHSCS